MSSILAISNLTPDKDFSNVKIVQSLKMVALLGYLVSWLGSVRGLKQGMVCESVTNDFQ